MLCIHLIVLKDRNTLTFHYCILTAQHREDASSVNECTDLPSHLTSKWQGLETNPDTTTFFSGKKSDALGWEINLKVCLPTFYIHSLFKNYRTTYTYT